MITASGELVVLWFSIWSRNPWFMARLGSTHWSHGVHKYDWSNGVALAEP